MLAAPVAAQPADRSAIALGASKEEVIAAHGLPKGQSRAGTREVLSYPQGQIVIEDGRVVRVDFSSTPVAQSPSPAPAPPPTTSARQEELPPADAWLTDFDVAAREAARRNGSILALFSHPSGSGASRQFDEEVASHPDFLNAFRNDFVFLRVEIPPQPGSTVPQQSAQLRLRYGVTAHPTLLILSPTGELLARVDPVPAAGAAMSRERIMASVREAWLLTGGTINPVESPGPAAKSRAEGLPPASAEMSSWLGSAVKTTTRAVVAGLLVMAVLFWLLWRKSGRAAPTRRADTYARIADAASGLPTLRELRAWPKEKVCSVVAGLAEAEGYAVTRQDPGSPVDFLLERKGDVRSCALVSCAGAEDGVLPVYRLRELTKAMATRKITEGWVVAPHGFVSGSSAFSSSHGLRLIDGNTLLVHLRDLPPLQLPGVLTRST